MTYFLNKKEAIMTLKLQQKSNTEITTKKETLKLNDRDIFEKVYSALIQAYPEDLCQNIFSYLVKKAIIANGALNVQA